MSVYVTGDTHSYIDVDKITPSHWPESNNLTEKDTLIICGDFGFVWDDKFSDRWWQQWFLRRPYITCFVAGNHENHPMLEKYPLVDFHGDKAHKINDHIYCFVQGGMYDFDGKKFFCFGKAQSHDKWHRKEGIDWWREEMPSDAEYQYGFDTLKKHDYKCDFVISHCASDTITDILSSGEYKHDKLTNFLQKVVAEDVTFDHWYFGHYHMDCDVDAEDGKKYTCVYQNIYKVV